MREDFYNILFAQFTVDRMFFKMGMLEFYLCKSTYKEKILIELISMYKINYMRSF